MSNFARKSPPPLADNAPTQDTEKMLLQRLESSTNEDERFRWTLFTVGYYRGVARPDAARGLLRRFLSATQNQEYRVQCQLALGQIATDEQKMEAAVIHFRAALELKPASKKIEYILHNNLGYCLNMVGRFDEGEKHCRTALNLIWTRPSAYRNLGVSLQGQGHLPAAAWALLEAMKIDSTDDRARLLLKKLASDHPSLLMQCPWVIDGIDPIGHAPKLETLSN